MNGAALEVFLQRASRAGLTPTERGETRDDRGELVAWRVELRRE